MLRFYFIASAAVALAACGSGGFQPDVDGGAPAEIDAGSILEDSEIVFDESVIRVYELEVAAADWQWLNDNATLEEYVPATLRWEGETYENIGIRYKGGFGSLFFCFDGQGNLICDKLSLKLKFNEYIPGARFHGLKRLNFHSMEKDPTKMHDAIGYKLFRDNGVIAPRTSYARFVVNGESQGLFVVVEQIDGRFARSRYSDGGEGNVYKEVWPVSTDPAPYIAALKTNKTIANVDKMVRFAEALGAATDATFVQVLEQWTDVDQLMRYMAVARLIDHWDGIVGWYCTGGPCFNHNYLFYESTTEDKLWLIPWDLDHTFEEPSPIRTFFGMPDWDDTGADCTPIPIFSGIQGRAPACDQFIGRMATLLWDRYVAATNTLLANDFQTASMQARIAELEQLISAEVAVDPRGPTAAEWQNSVNGFDTTVGLKRAYIEGKLP